MSNQVKELELVSRLVYMACDDELNMDFTVFQLVGQVVGRYTFHPPLFVTRCL